MRQGSIDKPFFSLTLILVFVGFFIFVSASLGLLARGEGLFSAIALNQTISLVLGLIACFNTSRIRFTLWNKYAFYIFLVSLFATLLVFMPFIGFEHAGARRWLILGPLSFQPAELLKFGFVMYLCAWFAGMKQRIGTFKYGVMPLMILLGTCGIVLALQPDFGTFIIIGVAGFSIFIAAGARWTHIVALALAGIVGLSALGFFVPYIQDRVLTFVDPSRDPLGAGYQIQQSLIAIGSGQFFGRGFGQSIQKFNFLPEPVGDSIFAVFAEEWGFLGSFLLFVLLVAFLSRGYRIANQAPTSFTRLVVVGIITMIVGQSFINIGSMLGMFPLTGDPLVFVSQGGSALIVALAEIGVILNISKFKSEPVIIEKPSQKIPVKSKKRS